MACRQVSIEIGAAHAVRAADEVCTKFATLNSVAQDVSATETHVGEVSEGVKRKTGVDRRSGNRGRQSVLQTALIAIQRGVRSRLISGRSESTVRSFALRER